MVAMTPATPPARPALVLHGAGMDIPRTRGRMGARISGHTAPATGTRTLWTDLNLEVAPGEFIAILGPNGSGKTTLLRAIAGLTPFTRGTALVGGKPVRRGLPSVGYIPQQRTLPPDVPIRGRDLIGMGIDGHTWGVGWLSPRRHRHRQLVEQALREVDAQAFADRPVGTLSGGEQQRIRAAQALVSRPALLLCDEPLVSLDFAQQKRLVEVIARQAREHRTAVLFVTHEINPVLPYVDRVLYLASSDHRIGTVAEVMRAETLSALFHSPVTVAQVAGRIVVVGTEEAGGVINPTAGEGRTHE